MSDRTNRPFPIDAGGAILIEVDFRKRSPHASIEFYDPSSATLTVTDPSSTVVVSSQVLSATNVNSTGLFHTVVQTSISWLLGIYGTTAIGFDGSTRDYNVETRVFELE